MRLIATHSSRSAARINRILRAFCLSILLGFTAGCMQLQVHVKLNPDGSAQITERLGLSRRLLDRQRMGSKEDSVERCLSRSSAEARAKQMGESVKLVDHKILEREDGSRESVVVYSAPDLNKIRIPAPFFGLKGHTKGYLECVLEPNYRTRWASPDRPGMMTVHFYQRGFPPQPKIEKGAPRPAGPSPKELQRYREFLPAFANMLKGFHVKLTFEAYNELYEGNQKTIDVVKKRGTGIPTGVYTILDLSDKHVDRSGRPIFESEEAMVEVMNGNFSGPHIHAQLGRMFHSNRVPVAFPMGFTYTYWRRAFKPSAYHYKKYFDGRPVWQGGNVKE